MSLLFSKRKIILWTLLAIGILASSIIGQTTRGMAIDGYVHDQNGAAIAGAKVKILQKDARSGLDTVTGEDGKFHFENLVGREYEITVFAKGFARQAETALAGEEIEITLRPEKIAEVVSVDSNSLAGSDEALEQTAGAIQTIDKETLEKSRVFNFSEALRKVPGVNVRDEEGFGLRPNIGIRGVNPTRSTKILLLEDGLPLAYAPYGDNASYYHPPVERFESIEVLKGSGQIAYGPVTVAGVVNYITPNPPEKPRFTAKLLGGNRGFFHGTTGFGGTFGKTGLLFNYTRKSGNGARENVHSGLNDLSSKIVQQLNDKNILTLKLSYFNEDSQVTYSGLTEAEYAANPRQNPFKNDRFDGFRIGFSASHTIVLNPRSSLTTTGYTNYFSRDWWRQSSNSNERPNRLTTDADCRGMQDLNTTCGNQGRLRDYRTWGVESRFNTNFDLGGIHNNFYAGFRVHGERQQRLQKNGDLPTSRDGIIAENNLRENLALSGFIQNRFVWKKFAIMPGLRIEKIDFKRTNNLNSASGKTELTQLIPGIGFTFNAFKNTTIFAGVHRGFAPPRTEDIITNAGGIVELDSELSWNYEAGIRMRPVNGISFEATFFRTDYENQVVPASVAGGTGALFTNGGKTLHQGVEFAGRFDTAKLFKTKYNFYLQSSYTGLGTAEFRGPRFSSISGFTNVSVAGNRLPYAPKHLFNSSLGLSYKNIDGFVENNYIGTQFADDLNSITPTPNGQRGVIPSQIYWNATLNYKVEKLKCVFFVTAKNIFDRTFIVDRSRGILPSGPRLLQTGFKISL